MKRKEKAYAQLPAKHRDLALGQLFSHAPLNGVEAAVSGQTDVAPPDGWAYRSCNDVWFRVEADAHPISIGHSQCAIVVQLIAIAHLVCKKTK